jgi:hypothetical protein
MLLSYSSSRDWRLVRGFEAVAPALLTNSKPASAMWLVAGELGHVLLPCHDQHGGRLPPVSTHAAVLGLGVGVD